jgi:hypothetical protein
MLPTPFPAAGKLPDRGDRARPHLKQVRRLEKLGVKRQMPHAQSPACGGRAGPAAPPRLLDLTFLEPSRPRPSRLLDPPPPPLDLPRVLVPLPPPLLAPSARSTRSSNSRRPRRSSESAFPPPLPPPRCCGMSTAAAGPPPPWWAANRRRAASSATRARADCLSRRARRCQDCSPRAVAASWRPTTEVAGQRQAAARRRRRDGGRPRTASPRAPRPEGQAARRTRRGRATRRRARRQGRGGAQRGCAESGRRSGAAGRSTEPVHTGDA